MPAVLRLSSGPLLAAIWLLILVGLFLARLFPEAIDFCVWAAAVHIPYLGYPLLVSGALAPGRLTTIAVAAAVSFLVFIPFLAIYESPTVVRPTWLAPASLLAGVAWIFVLWRGAAALRNAHASDERPSLLLLLLQFFILAWGGVIPLQRRVRPISGA